jgi:hypothetical protein
MGEDDPKACAFFKADQAVTTNYMVKELKAPLPWGGNVFGVADLSYLASIARPRLVGLVGPQNAGKTTFLGKRLIFPSGVRANGVLCFG